jgi:ankyrin repeat protein
MLIILELVARGYDMLKFLVEQGSLIDSKNKRGETPLIVSLQYSQTEVATYLISHGASVLSCDGHGASVLSNAKSFWRN